MFLIGDEGLCLKDEIIAVKNPTLSFDGGISFPLPFHVFKQHCVDRGGFVATSEYHESYRVMLCAYGLLSETHSGPFAGWHFDAVRGAEEQSLPRVDELSSSPDRV